MRAIVARKHGPPEILTLQDMPDPRPRAGEVLVRVRAIGVNFADLLARMGLYPPAPKPPFVPGIELAGVVERIGESGISQGAGGSPSGLAMPRVGDAVAAFAPFGAYAEWATVPAATVFPIPAGMPFEDAAAIPVTFATAYHSMFAMGNLQPGDHILIHGAGGGVGLAAVQLARARGLIIFGTAGPAKQEFLKKMGVDHAINYERDDFVQVVRKLAPGGLEMVMDPIGGRSLARSYQCLGPTGRLVVYGFSAPVGPSGRRNLASAAKALLQTPRFHPLKLMRDNTSVIGVSLGRMPARGNLLRAEMDEIFRMYSGGKIKAVVAKSFPLAEAAAAHRFLHERRNIGKVILTVK